jgi:hypothetical protein
MRGRKRRRRSRRRKRRRRRRRRRITALRSYSPEFAAAE